MNNYDHNVLFRISTCCSPRKMAFFVDAARIMLLQTRDRYLMARTKMWELEKGIPTSGVCQQFQSTRKRSIVETGAYKEKS